MSASAEAVRDFVLQLDKTLGTRRLYAPNSTTYRDANERALEKCRAAAGTEGFTLHFGAMDISLDKQVLLQKSRPEESFFFPLYRDGLRELTFTPETSLDDLTALLGVFELKDHQLGPADDTVTHLWRADLQTIRHNAIDGIGDVEEDSSGTKIDFRGLVAQLLEQIRTPELSAVGESAASRPEHDPAAMRRTFEENPDVLRITEEQLGEIRTEMSQAEDQKIVERFIEILLVIVRLPFRSIDPAKIAPIFTQILEGFWTAREFERLIVLLTYIDSVSEEAPSPKARQAMAAVVLHFLTDDRVTKMIAEAEQKTIGLPLIARLWNLLPDERGWSLMIDAWIRVVDPELRAALQKEMRKHLAQNPDLLKATFASSDAAHVRAALALLDEKTEGAFAEQLMALAAHPDDSIRLKGLAAASKHGGAAGLEVLWKAMESDPAKSVRLFAFRSIAASKNPDLAPRLRWLVNTPQFAARPVWEREKYVRLLGSVAGSSAEALFESWIPSKRWMWQTKDLEILELALRGLGACGDSGYEKVRLMAESGGKPGEVARKVLDSISRAEISDQTSFMRPLPTEVDK